MLKFHFENVRLLLLELKSLHERIQREQFIRFQQFFFQQSLQFTQLQGDLLMQFKDMLLKLCEIVHIGDIEFFLTFEKHS